ncbi:MAG: hypothetical protein EAZ95_05690 [Bacteroidetes bacterium]|nr:MAG: hypothetical protein EAZ95_05690 [Bacteroidota bacterium]
MHRLLFLVLCLACTEQTRAQTPTNLGGWYPNGYVTGMAEDATHIYMAGQFTRLIKTGVSGAFTSGTGVNTTGTGEVVHGFPAVFGKVSVCISDGAGGWYIGGKFTKVGGVTRSGLAHINPDKSLDMLWNPNVSNDPYEYEINALLLSGTDLYVGGGFISIGGVSRRGIAKLSATGTGAVDMMWNPNASGGGGWVHALALSGTDLYVGGHFGNIGGSSSNIAKLSTTGTGVTDTAWRPYIPDVAVVYCLALSGTDLYVGGGGLVMLVGYLVEASRNSVLQA